LSKLLSVRKEGGSRVLTVTKIIPINWNYVTVESVKEKAGSLTIKINKVS
jgi:hypothetical protein